MCDTKGTPRKDRVGQFSSRRRQEGQGLVEYICEDVVQPIIFFGYTPQEVKQLIGEWFSDKFELPLKIVHHVDKDRLN